MTADNPAPLYTIGHSVLEAEKFVSLCNVSGVSTILDIRSHPSSRWPQFCKESLEIWLPAYGIDYIWYPGLGGWTAEDMQYADEFLHYGVDIAAYSKGQFPKQRIGVPRQVEPGEPGWTNQGLYDYSWFTTLQRFQDAAWQLALELRMDRYQGRPPAIMCAEVLWWKCHRSMVADYMEHVLETPVWHLQPSFKRHKDAMGNRIDRYLPEVRRNWPFQNRRPAWGRI